VNNSLERGPLFAEGLGAVGLFPDAGFSQLQLYFRQTFLAFSEVKDTP
jgi:hypothetical protein